MDGATVERKNSTLTERNRHQNQNLVQYKQPSVATNWGLRRRTHKNGSRAGVGLLPTLMKMLIVREQECVVD